MNSTVAETPKTEEKVVNLFDVGSLLNLSVGTWSGRKMLTKADFLNVGIDPSNLPEDIVNYGRKLLVPKSELQAITKIEQRARTYLANWSVPFGIANSHFVPVKKLADVEQHLKDLKEEFETAVDSFVSRFGDLKATVQKSHPEFWEKCLRNHYPHDPQSLRSKFRFKWFVYRISGMDSIQKSSTDEIIAKQTVLDEKTAYERATMQQEVQSFVGEYVDTMRSETIKFCELMTARINGKPYGDEDQPKKLTPRSLHYFKKHIDRFRQMNIFGDKEIEKMLAEFKNNYLAGDSTVDSFDNRHMKDSVTKSLAAIKSKAAEQGEESSQFIGSLKRKIVI